MSESIVPQPKPAARADALHALSWCACNNCAWRIDSTVAVDTVRREAGLHAARLEHMVAVHVEQIIYYRPTDTGP